MILLYYFYVLTASSNLDEFCFSQVSRFFSKTVRLLSIGFAHQGQPHRVASIDPLFRYAKVTPSAYPIYRIS